MGKEWPQIIIVTVTLNPVSSELSTYPCPRSPGAAAGGRKPRQRKQQRRGRDSAGCGYVGNSRTAWGIDEALSHIVTIHKYSTCPVFRDWSPWSDQRINKPKCFRWARSP
jgi:hypothetical protein